VTIARTVRRILLSSACMVAAPAAFAADAPPAAGQLETVEVRAQRQAFRGDTPIEQLPQSVQLISSELLQDVNVTQLDDVLDLASGVARQNTFGGLWDAFAIRGFAGDENTPTGYLVNGFNAGRGFSGRRDASNIDRVEVVKGPGSALFGRAEPGGTINIITKKPQFAPEGSIELQAGRFNTYRAAADYTTPVSERVAVRINGAYEDADSFRDYIHRRKVALSPSFLVNFTDSTSLGYELEYLDQKAPFDRGVVASPSGQLGIVPISRFLGEPGDGDTQIKATGHQATLQHSFNKNWNVLVGAGFRTSSFTGFSSDPELVAGRQPFYQSANLTTFSRLLSRQRRFRDYDADDTVLRAELSGRIASGGITHHVLIGVDYFRYQLDTLQLRFRPTLANPYAVDVFAPVYGQTRTPGNFQNQRENQDGKGIYIQDQIDVTSKLKILAGVRYDDFTQKFLFRLTNTIQRSSKTATSPRLGVAYDVTPAVNLYAAWSKGFRPNTGTNFQNTPFDPEFSKSYEVGTKLTLGNVVGTIAIYKAKKSNILTADPINAGFSLAAGEAESKGLEIDFAGQITETLRFNFSYAYTDAEITKSSLDPNFGLALPAGSRLINIPKSSGNVLLMKSFDVGSAKFTTGIGATYVGERLGETGVPSFQLPAYTLVNLTASYAPTEQLKFTVDVDNALDKEYYPSSYARLWIAPGAPRMYTVRALYKF
jgi:iron complex outermembrane receptor protein